MIHERIDRLEQYMRKIYQAPTVPIYDVTALPQDAVAGQIAIGVDLSFNWYDGSSWHSQAGTPSIIGDIPQDFVDGQVCLGTDNSFNWCINQIWYSAPFTTSITGDTPQDAVIAQVAIGSDGSFQWFDGTDWQSFGTV